jgi:hypothetical protein
MNIVFYGASVTAQNKLGYVGEFKNLIKDIYYSSALPNACVPERNYNIIQEGYGGMHIRDAGIYMIDKIILHEPNMCLLIGFQLV